MKLSKIWLIPSLTLGLWAIGAIVPQTSNTLGVNQTAEAAGPASVADLAERLIGAVVNISTSQNVESDEHDEEAVRPQIPEGAPFQDLFDDFFNSDRNKTESPSARKVQSLGSGFVVDPKGIIITNNHVIADADEITIEFTDGSELKAEVLGKDTKTDLAVLKVKPTKPLQAVSFGRSSKSRVGDWVMAIGNPFGQGSSVTLGIVSAINRDIQSGPYDSFIQTDASINRGNSGGPLFNMEGEVIGINTAIISPSGGSIGLGFSVPSDLAAKVVRQLQEFGETRRGWLGVSIQPVTDEIAESLLLTLARGALVAGLTVKGPAEKHGIKVGDVILKFDGKPINEMRDLPRIVAETKVGKTVDVIVFRNGKRVSVPVILGRLENDEEQKTLVSEDPKEEKPISKTFQAMGLQFSDLTDEKRAEQEIDKTVKGVLIVGVEEGSQAAEKGIENGDVISEIAQQAVSSIKAVEERLENLKKEGRTKALLLIAKSDGQLSFVVLDVK